MNKYKFISKEKTETKKFEEEDKIYFKELRKYKLDFSGGNIRSNDIVFDGIQRTSSQPIVKSEIQESLKKQFQELFKMHKNISFFKMNSTTKNKLRTFYSHEVDYVPRNSTNEIGKIIGTLMGVKIVLDEKVEDFFIVLVNKFEPQKIKNKFIFKEVI